MREAAFKPTPVIARSRGSFMSAPLFAAPIQWLYVPFWPRADLPAISKREYFCVGAADLEMLVFQVGDIGKPMMIKVE